MLICEVALGAPENRLRPPKPSLFGVSSSADKAQLNDYHEWCKKLTYDNVFLGPLRKRSTQAIGTKYRSGRGHEEYIVYHPTQCKPVYLVELVSPGLGGRIYNKSTDSYKPCYADLNKA